MSQEPCLARQAETAKREAISVIGGTDLSTIDNPFDKGRAAGVQGARCKNIQSRGKTKFSAVRTRRVSHMLCKESNLQCRPSTSLLLLLPKRTAKSSSANAPVPSLPKTGACLQTEPNRKLFLASHVKDIKPHQRQIAWSIIP